MGAPCHPEQLLLQGPPVMVERPRSIGNVCVARMGLPDTPETDRIEIRRWIGFQERPCQDVASSCGKERLVAAPPRQHLISPLGVPALVVERGVVGHGL